MGPDDVEIGPVGGASPFGVCSLNRKRGDPAFVKCVICVLHLAARFCGLGR